MTPLALIEVQTGVATKVDALTDGVEIFAGAPCFTSETGFARELNERESLPLDHEESAAYHPARLRSCIKKAVNGHALLW